LSDLSLPTVGLNGVNKIRLNVNREFQQPELTLVNNVISREFVINRDPFNPILDVTFDGRRIFDRDIVAPSTEVIMTIKDNNPLIDQADTTNFLVKYKKSTELNYQRIYFADPNNLLELLPANDDGKAQAALRFKDLSDGVYDLSVEVVDMSGNPSGVRPYTISFEVINETSITHFYPYPNPFSTRMKFVYTLTGDRVPEDIMIQIFTVSGKVVREISRADLEPIFIGNNISDFSWDGTDQYGDRLANGVYFYKVTVKDNGSNLKRASKEIDRNGEKFFKNNTGKIYLMR
jgi:hypothetical protein